jgi:DNA primase
VKFLYLPAEHDPDSFVRDLGPEAFEACIAQAVPLSRQVAETAREGKDLDTAEGRAHMLADAKPLWSALPDGALKRLLVGELAALGHMEVTELMAMWGAAAAPRSAREASAPRPPPTRRAGRLGKGTASLLDRAIWLLLHRCDMWSALDGESHDVLAAQPAPYDMFFSCIERCLDEQGPIAPAALLEALRVRAEAQSDGVAALARIAGFHAPEAGADFAHELALVVGKLRLQAVDDELKLLFESGVQSVDAQQRSRELMEARRKLKA